MDVAPKEKLNKLFSEVCEIIREADDGDILNLFGSGSLDELIKAIATPKNAEEGIYDYLFLNKNRLKVLSGIRLAIHKNYSMKGTISGRHGDIYVSPYHVQWYSDGVMFVQGEKQFEGLIGLYQDGEVKFAISRIDARPGEEILPDSLEFVKISELEKRSRQPNLQESKESLENDVSQLESLIQKMNNDENEYQDFFSSYPWVFGAKYYRIDSHLPLNDENIPDFTGVRVRDQARDIIEIKPPFLQLFKKDSNDFRAEFNDAWNQTERYLDFTRNNADYLKREKGLYFDNPQCYLLAGYDLSSSQLKQIRRKERMNPAITILTYNDILAMAKSTITFVKSVKNF